MDISDPQLNSEEDHIAAWIEVMSTVMQLSVHQDDIVPITQFLKRLRDQGKTIDTFLAGRPDISLPLCLGNLPRSKRQ